MLEFIASNLSSVILYLVIGSYLSISCFFFLIFLYQSFVGLFSKTIAFPTPKDIYLRTGIKVNGFDEK